MSLWTDLTPSKRCDWIDQLRGWAVIVMIEVHAVNVWLHAGLRPDWLNYLNGLVAPSFTMATMVPDQPRKKMVVNQPAIGLRAGGKVTSVPRRFTLTWMREFAGC